MATINGLSELEKQNVNYEPIKSEFFWHCKTKRLSVRDARKILQQLEADLEQLKFYEPLPSDNDDFDVPGISVASNTDIVSALKKDLRYTCPVLYKIHKVLDDNADPKKL